MKRKFLLCRRCGNLIEMINDSGVTPICCGTDMNELTPNSVEAATEKHIPVVEIDGNIAKVTVGSTLHPMEEAHYIEWMVRNEVTHYIAALEELRKEPPVDKTQKEPRDEVMEELIEKISIFVSDENKAERIKGLLLACRNDRERQLLAFRIGLEDGVPKTLQETADRFGISRERTRQIESMAVRKTMGHIWKRKARAAFLED